MYVTIIKRRQKNWSLNVVCVSAGVRNISQSLHDMSISVKAIIVTWWQSG